MNQYPLFSSSTNEDKEHLLALLISRNDIKGVVNYLEKLPEMELTAEVLKNGYHIISFKHGRDKVIQDVIKQIKK